MILVTMPQCQPASQPASSLFLALRQNLRLGRSREIELAHQSEESHPTLSPVRCMATITRVKSPSLFRPQHTYQSLRPMRSFPSPDTSAILAAELHLLSPVVCLMLRCIALHCNVCTPMQVAALPAAVHDRSGPDLRSPPYRHSVPRGMGST